MNIHEYQGKSILKSFGVAIQERIVAETPEQAVAAAKQVMESATAQYQCPMKCEGEKTYDKPGQCPKCNMDLQKVEEMHEHHEHDSTHTNH